MKIYNRRVFITGIVCFLHTILVIYITLKDFDLKLLIISLILLVCSCVCIILGFSKKAYQKNLSALEAQKELEKTNKALKFLNSAENISTGIGIFFGSISVVLLIIALTVLIKN